MLQWTHRFTYFFEIVIFVSFQYIPRSRTAGSRVLFLIFWGPSILFSIVAALHSHQQYTRVPFFPHPPQHLYFVFLMTAILTGGFSGGASAKEPACQCRSHKRHRFDLWVRKIPWRRALQPTPVFFPGESRAQRSLVGYSPWCHTESDITEVA